MSGNWHERLRSLPVVGFLRITSSKSKTMITKKKHFIPVLILGTVSVFILLVAYKYISSSIDESRVLRAKEPLNQCLEVVDQKAEAQVRNFEYLIRDLSTPGSQKQCLNADSHGNKVDDLVASGQMTIEEYCRPPSLREREIEVQKIHDVAEKEKEACYKQYK